MLNADTWRIHAKDWNMFGKVNSFGDTISWFGWSKGDVDLESIWVRYTGIQIWIPDGNFSNSCFTVHAAGDRLWIVKDGGVYSDRAVKDAEQGEYRIYRWNKPDRSFHSNPQECSAKFADDGKSLRWRPTGEVWRRYDRSEIWIADGAFDHPCHIHRAGSQCWFVNPKGAYSGGIVDSPARVSALDWRNADGTPHSIRTNTGKVSDDGKTITWDNGRIWKALDRSDWSAALTPDGKIDFKQ